MALTQESLLSFLLEHGGKVKNSELLNNFRSHISGGDPAEKQHNRDVFKRLVNSVAVVKQIDEVKFVVVKKRYQDFVKEGTSDAPQKPQMEASFSSQNTSFSYTSPHRAEAARMIYSDIENNNMCINGNYCSDAKRSVQERKPLSRSADTTTVKVLNISGDQASRARKSGSVFAVIAVKSPPRDSALCSAPATQDGLHSRVHPHKTSDKPITKVSTPLPPVPTLNTNIPACKKGALKDSQCWKNRQIEDMQAPGFPLLRPHNKRDDAKYSESVPLEPSAHEWLVKCAAGLWGQIYGLLLQDARLAQKKDFMSGFTALHWAAKDGNVEMINKLVDISRKRGTYVDINSKAHGGYTPLHIAAVHGRTEVMVLLVQSYGANVNERDNDGKKAFHYLAKGVSAEVRALMGELQPQQSKDREKTEDGEYREHSKGFNTLSKLFQPHTGKKQKTKLVHDC